MNELWSVAVNAPLAAPLTYKGTLDLKPGQWVEVPLGRRKAQGLLIGPQTNSSPTEFEIKNILSSMDYPAMPCNYLQWLVWLAEYYNYPLGLVASSSLPPLAKKNARGSRKPSVTPEKHLKEPPKLTSEQKVCIDSILPTMGSYAAHLIHGVTGSGKTEIYLQLLEKTLQRGQSGLVLVPEISLTPQLIDRFIARFGQKVAVLHSQLTDRERTEQWWAMVQQEKQILIGARSALFCPVNNLGLIVIDEEHEPSFKQEEKLKYHARDAAVMLAYLSSCPILLGSATPSLESWHNAQEGKYQLHSLKNRVAETPLPEIQVINMRDQNEESRPPELLQANIPKWLSTELYLKIQETLKRKRQVALFLNRRGMAQVIFCPDCGHVRECPNCDISLTLHAKTHLICHYCDYHENFKTLCPDCNEGELTPLGLGTELVEKEISKLFPEANVARADRDEITTRKELEDMIQNMESGHIDILIGTQMIAKGLDFQKLELVGLLLADIGFNLPDFRSSERSFQLITQMSGRAGRHISSAEERGQVLVQTYNPEHTALRYALAHDYKGFAEQELAARRELHYPPYGKLLSIRLQSAELGRVQEAARTLTGRAHHVQEQNLIFKPIEILGPAPAPMAKLRGQFRYNVLLKAPEAKRLGAFIKTVLGDQAWLPIKVRLQLDVDPMHML